MLHGCARGSKVKLETGVTTMTIAADSTPESTGRLKRELKAAESRKRAMALLLIAPLAIFLLLIFVVPIGALLTRAAQNPEVANALPHTLSALSALGPQNAAAGCRVSPRSPPTSPRSPTATAWARSRGA